MVFGDKNSDLCLLHKTKSFDLKNIISKKKKVFGFVKDQICFVVIKKKWFFDDRKIKSIFLYILK